MKDALPFLIGAGPLEELKMEVGSQQLARAWGKRLIPHWCGENPDLVLADLPAAQALVQLNGDAAMAGSCGSWLEALAAWRQPVILLVSPLPSGGIPGIAAAYAALCQTISVPLIGLVQLGGLWDQTQRRADGLAWCGWVQADHDSQGSTESGNEDTDPIMVSTQLRHRLLML